PRLCSVSSKVPPSYSATLWTYLLLSLRKGLWVEGVAILNRRCAMCRAEIPPDYLDHPILLERLSPQQLNTDDAQVEYHGGECTLLLAGALYSIDFENMTQVKCNDRTRRRHVRRDTPLFPAKGIAGIKSENSNRQPTKTDDNSNSNNNQDQADDVIDLVIVDDDSDSDVQIVNSEPVVIQIDDISEELDRLSLVNSEVPEPSSGDA
ncbi:Uncharacterized protein OBRU01_07958, partial [Operophtera brumata]